MASIFTNEAKRAFAAGEFDWGDHDFRVRLVMADTTCDTENDGIVTLANYTDIDPADCSGTIDKALVTESVNKDDPNDRAELDADDVVFTSLGGNATANFKGVLLYKFVDGTNANDLAVAFVEFATPITQFATQITIPWDAQGILQLT